MKMLLALVLVVVFVVLPDVAHGQLPGLPLDCPVGWKKNFRTKMCYWFRNNDYVPQYKAGQQCGNRGGRLVVIEDKDENDFLAENYEINPNDTARSQFAWTALYEKNEGNWWWESVNQPLNSTLADLVWGDGQPDDYRGGEDFGVLEAKTGYWYDMRSNQDYGYICEKAIPTAPPPTNPPPTTATP